MFPQALGAATSSLETGASLIAVQQDVVNSSSMASLGAIVGDVVLVLGVSTPRLQPGNINLMGAQSGAYYKQLTSGDLTRNIEIQQGTTQTVLIYRGCAAIGSGVTATSFGTIGTQSLAGFTKHAKHAGLVCHMRGGTNSTVSVNLPATFTTRAYYNVSVGGGSSGRHLCADRLQPVNPVYVSGTPFEWRGTASGSILVIELLTA